jgi:hypothetical protein
MLRGVRTAGDRRSFISGVAATGLGTLYLLQRWTIHVGRCADTGLREDQSD